MEEPLVRFKSATRDKAAPTRAIDKLATSAVIGLFSHNYLADSSTKQGKEKDDERHAKNHLRVKFLRVIRRYRREIEASAYDANQAPASGPYAQVSLSWAGFQKIPQSVCGESNRDQQQLAMDEHSRERRPSISSLFKSGFVKVRADDRKQRQNNAENQPLVTLDFIYYGPPTPTPTPPAG
jgi:hypothetical protein